MSKRNLQKPTKNQRKKTKLHNLDTKRTAETRIEMLREIDRCRNRCPWYFRPFLPIATRIYGWSFFCVDQMCEKVPKFSSFQELRASRRMFSKTVYGHIYRWLYSHKRQPWWRRAWLRWVIGREPKK